MNQEKFEVSTRIPRCKCIESRTDSKRLHYSRFILSPLMKGQADTIGIAMRRALLGEVEGTCITRAKFENAPHEYSMISGVEESVYEILMNLKKIVLRSDLYGTRNASICAKGPEIVTARHIILPPSVEIVDTSQHIASLTKPIDLRIELQIERGRRMKTTENYQDGSFPIDAVSMPVRNANYSIHSFGNEKQEILFLEIWTDGSLTPKEALYEASRNLINLFIPFLDAEEQDLNFDLEDNQKGFQGRFHTYPPFNITKMERKEVLEDIFIDQLGLSRRTYNWLKRSNIHTLSDFLNLTPEDLARMRIDLPVEDINQILYSLEKHFLIHTFSDFLNLAQEDLARMRIDPPVEDLNQILDSLEKHSPFDEPKNENQF
uniref:RNA polymerase alpha subunit n=1 Tax=Oxandra asbeckii TaxID=306925 RepID=UPI002E799C98|nr:RNA polymerase alpha subunit [Oxandra asbeckii]YP_010998097.1 RNA polymerase alpha subunit [Oxandra asbeckii]WPF64699.1 RNA polymerase alpha subunit [Oxandra asbeckii]WPF64740.1 RNA polymerase alpha subunit [Oxandra asbeckii]